jgi:hypothetical protein
MPVIQLAVIFRKQACSTLLITHGGGMKEINPVTTQLAGRADVVVASHACRRQIIICYYYYFTRFEVTTESTKNIYSLRRVVTDCESFAVDPLKSIPQTTKT